MADLNTPWGHRAPMLVRLNRPARDHRLVTGHLLFSYARLSHAEGHALCLDFAGWGHYLARDLNHRPLLHWLRLEVHDRIAVLDHQPGDGRAFYHLYIARKTVTQPRLVEASDVRFPFGADPPVAGRRDSR